MKRIDQVSLGTPFSATAKKVLLCGAGELGKEVAIELQRFGVEVIAVDRYENAPAMQVADRSHVISMLDGEALERVIRIEMPDLIVPEIEAIATQTLLKLEQEGFEVVPTAKAAQLTMNREGIRRLAAETLELTTSPYQFADSREEYLAAVALIGMPCVVKPVMSSSGKGQSVVRIEGDIDAAWVLSQSGGRTGQGRVIIEGFVPFDYEITLLTVRHRDGVSFCEPIGHHQEGGDYQQSWQPQAMKPEVLKQAQCVAEKVTTELGGLGLFGVEFFIKGETVYFSEVSPRPHDTGLVTLISQNLSEFALHVLAILNLPIPTIRQYGPAASSAILLEAQSRSIRFGNLEKALAQGDTQLRLFGKPEVNGVRRMGVGLALADSIDEAVAKAKFVSETLTCECSGE